jgi:hypothetical protein
MVQYERQPKFLASVLPAGPNQKENEHADRRKQNQAQYVRCEKRAQNSVHGDMLNPQC